MVEWHHQYNGHELGQTSGDGEGQGGVARCNPWGCKELGMTGPLSNNSNMPDTKHSECNVCPTGVCVFVCTYVQTHVFKWGPLKYIFIYSFFFPHTSDRASNLT